MYRLFVKVMSFLTATPPAVTRRYFTLFMNLLNDCSEVEDDGQPVGGRKRGMSRRLASLRHCTVLAMSNLLNANVDSGLMHSIGESACRCSGIFCCGRTSICDEAGGKYSHNLFQA